MHTVGEAPRLDAPRQPSVDGETFVGIVTTADILRLDEILGDNRPG